MRPPNVRKRLEHIESRIGRHCYVLHFKNGSEAVLELGTRQLLKLLELATEAGRIDRLNFELPDKAKKETLAPDDQRLGKILALIRRANSFAPPEKKLMGMVFAMAHHTEKEHLIFLHSRGCYKGLSGKALDFCRALPRSEACPQDADYEQWLKEHLEIWRGWRSTGCSAPGVLS